MTRQNLSLNVKASPSPRGAARLTPLMNHGQSPYGKRYGHGYGNSNQRRGKTPKSKKVNTRLYKTNLCRTFTKMGSCPYGAKCQFAHGEAELKPIPQDLDDRPAEVNEVMPLGLQSPFNVSVLYAGTNSVKTSTPRAPVLTSPKAKRFDLRVKTPINNHKSVIMIEDMSGDEDKSESEYDGPTPDSGSGKNSSAFWDDNVNTTPSPTPEASTIPHKIPKKVIKRIKPLESPSQSPAPSSGPKGKFALKLNLTADSPRVLNLSAKSGSSSVIQSPRISMLNLSSPNKETPIPSGARVDCDPRLYKTELCRSYSQNGVCRYGEKCQFAHGIEELRPAPQRVHHDGSPSSPRSFARKEPLSPRIVKLQIEDDANLESASEEEMKTNYSDLTLQVSPRLNVSRNYQKSPRVKDPRVYKTELCKKFEAMGECPYGIKCQFAHGVQELRPRLPMSTTNASTVTATYTTREASTPKGTPDPKLYKTELCRSFNRTGYCRYGLKCQFAHGIKELRPSPKLMNSESRAFTFGKSPLNDLSVLNDSKYVADSPRNLTVSPIIGSPRRKAPLTAPARSNFTFDFNIKDD